MPDHLLGEITFENHDVEGQVSAFELRRLQDDDGVGDAVALGAEDRDRRVGRILCETVWAPHPTA